MNQKLTIPCELPALNQVLDDTKRHWSKYHATKKRYTAVVASLARRQLKPISDFKHETGFKDTVSRGQVYLTFTWYCRNRKRDPDNVCSAKKFIIDGLVEAGILANDGWKQIAGFTDRFELDRANPRVEVRLKSIAKGECHAKANPN